MNMNQSLHQVNFNPRVLAFNNSWLMVTLRVSAFLASCLSVKVFSMTCELIQKKLYKLMCITCYIDLVYTACLLFFTIFSSLCAYQESAKCHTYTHLTFILLYVILSEYLTSCLAIFGILFELYITLHRILIIKESSWSWKIRSLSITQISLVLFSISFLIYMPYLFSYSVKSIVTNNGETIYRLYRTSFGRSHIFTVYMNIVSGLRLALVTFVLFILNCFLVNLVRYRFTTNNSAILYNSNHFNHFDKYSNSIYLIK